MEYINSTGIIYNNFIQLETTGYGYGIYLYNCSSISVLHNTIKITGNSSSGSCPIYDGSTTAREIKNNIFVNLAYGRVMNCDTTNLTSDYNLLYTNGSLLVQSNINYANLTDWQAASGRDQHSVSRKPEFLSATNLHTNDPWMNNWGTPLTEVTIDIDGESRDAVNPDVGADEFDGIMPFEGEYTIGSTGDFKSFTEAVDTITPVGLSGPVTFKVESGTYNEQFIITAIPEVTETNTITFQSASGDSTDVILTYESTSADTNYTVKMDGADYIRFKNLTLQATGDDYANVIAILNGASNNQFHNNRFIGVKANLLSTNGALVYSPYGNVNNTNNIFNENLFLSGSYGIYFSAHYSVSENNNQLTGNRFEGQVSGGIYLYYQDSALISMNEISNALSEKDYYGIYFYGTNSQINRNEINLINYRYNCTGVSISGNDETKPSSFSNNFVHISTNGYGNITGINLSYCNSYYNSINITGVHSGSYAIVLPNFRSCSLKNNIFLNNAGGNAINYSDGSAANVSSNYNDLYSNGDYLAYYNSTNLADLVEWTAATTFDANSVFLIPCSCLIRTCIHKIL